ncbi:MAG: HD domain-containing protein [Solirubrobacteraceae bacterium MAG38_C4-C5]|nr:HD domain-containing protein [Candidatus Siliceabacter maunaloa]
MSAPAPRPGRILIVDDEPGNVLALKPLLELAGYRDVRCTSNPARADALYAQLRPDLILLDLHMLVLDGFAVMRRLSTLIDADDYVPILVLTADADADADAAKDSRWAALEGEAADFVVEPLDHAEVVTRVANLLDVRSRHVQLRQHNETLERAVRERTAELAQTVDRLQHVEHDLRLAEEETIHRLALAAEVRDDETSRHIERMSRYCAILVARAGEGQRQRDLLRIAARMHDIGKLGIPDAILHKPGRLTAHEYEIMKGHAEIGYRILEGSKSELARAGATLAWTHHEKVDGTGYPRGLRGEQIPLEGRIAAIADVFDALTTDRVYRPAFPLPEALTTMRAGRATHFDPDLLDLFLGSLDEVLAAREGLADATVA